MESKTVITYGTFDMFHIGHLKLLQRAKEYGDKLIVAVSTDEFNEQKGKKTLISFAQRSEIVANIKCVDEVISENSWEQKPDDIKSYKVNTFLMGDDWKGKFDYLENLCNVVYVPRTEKISSTQLKKSLINFTSIPKEDILRAFEVIEVLKRDFE
ncbi:adenylyltransferase/cytidyltransferase family protein [Sulfurovum sp.]|uniref:adenylyltransferase/cytidyltransferase family protein n=1 Tax=Sulfurovum sp. TaxID=1969726 RepID=UPI003459D2DB